MAFPYTNLHDARQHLLNTCILFDGKPAWIANIIGDETPDRVDLQACLDLFDGNDATVSLWDTRIQTRNFTLGYVNYRNSGQCVYLQRNPRRQYQQGLSNNNVTVSNGDSFSRIARSKAFRDAMTNKYPSLSQCLTILANSTGSMAFSVDFCVRTLDSGLVEVVYQEVPAGVVVNGQVHLGPKFQWLSKYLPKD